MQFPGAIWKEHARSLLVQAQRLQDKPQVVHGLERVLMARAELALALGNDGAVGACV